MLSLYSPQLPKPTTCYPKPFHIQSSSHWRRLSILIWIYIKLLISSNVNTRRLSKPNMGSIFHIKNQWNTLVIWNYYVNVNQHYQNLMLLTSSDTKWTLMHLFFFTNSAQREPRVYSTAINFPCIITLVQSRIPVLVPSSLLERNWVLFTNSDFLILISLHFNVGDLIDISSYESF